MSCNTYTVYLAGVHSLLHGTTVAAADDLSTLANASLTSNLQESYTGPCELLEEHQIQISRCGAITIVAITSWLQVIIHRVNEQRVVRTHAC